MKQEINCCHEFRADLERENHAKSKPKNKIKNKQTKNLKSLFRNGD